MKHLTATFISIFSAFLLYMSMCLIFSNKENAVPTIAWVAFFGGWIATHYFTVRNTNKSLKVLSRGFLIGGLEWLLMAFSGFVLSSKLYVRTAEGAVNQYERAGAAIGSGLSTAITGGISIGMAMFCFLGFALTYFLSRELKKEDLGEMRECSDCAELVKVNAKKCKHCGATLEGSNLTKVA
jgi:Na+/H+-translocating membrane pyrophosphatase